MINNKQNMIKISLMIWIFLCIFPDSLVASKKVQQAPNFSEWLDKLKVEAIKKRISKETLEKTLFKVKPLKRVIELDRKQPEFSMTFSDYIKKSVTKKRVRQGRQLLGKYKNVLDSVSGKFDVQQRFLIAFWGLETNYGNYTGSFPIVPALVTLAHDRRRASFFRNQLFAALKLIDQGHIRYNARGSWAGAMGNHQFMPTTYRDFATDFDQDGAADLWNSKPDTFASAANYLKKAGWDSSKNWGREVKLPTDFEFGLSGLKERRKLYDWGLMGVKKTDGSALPEVDIDACLLLPSGYRGPAFLVYSNFRSILIWNRSIYYALAVGLLADQLIFEKPVLDTPLVVEPAMSRSEIKEIQKNLEVRGYNPGGVDGILGSKTRLAIKSFQKNSQQPEDGHPSVELLKTLRNSGL